MTAFLTAVRSHLHVQVLPGLVRVRVPEPRGDWLRPGALHFTVWYPFANRVKNRDSRMHGQAEAHDHPSFSALLEPPETKCISSTTCSIPYPLPDLTPAQCFRHSGSLPLRRRVWQALIRTGASASRRNAFEFCGSNAYVLKSPDNPPRFKLAGSACHDRFCLPCANDRSRIVATNVLGYLEDTTARFLTLTLKHNPNPLEIQLARLNKAFRTLRKTAFWKQHVTGGVAFVELKYNNTTSTWHPHIHCLLQGHFIPQVTLSRLWYSITGDSLIVDIRLVRSGRSIARYITKYASKPLNTTYSNEPDLLDEVMRAIKGKRLCMTFGSWRSRQLSAASPETGWENIGSLTSFIDAANNHDSFSLDVLEALDPTYEPPAIIEDPHDRPRSPPGYVPTLQRTGTFWNLGSPLF